MKVIVRLELNVAQMCSKRKPNRLQSKIFMFVCLFVCFLKEELASETCLR